MKRLSYFLMLAITLRSLAQSVPASINYQGRLTDNSPQQAPLTATVNMSFELWDCAACATPAPDRLWAEPASGTVPVAVTGGIFNVMLGGNGVPLPASLFTGGTQRYLQLIVNGEALTPRQQLGASGYAAQAENAASATTASSATTAATAGNSLQLGGVAASGYQRATTTGCGAGEYVKSIAPTGATACGTPATNVPVPLSLSGDDASSILTVSNAGAGTGITAQSAGGSGLSAGTSSSDPYQYGVNGWNSGLGDAGDFTVGGNPNSYGSAVSGFNWSLGYAGVFRIVNPASGAAALYADTDGTGPAGYLRSENPQSTPLRVSAVAIGQIADLQSWDVRGTVVASLSPAGDFSGGGAGLTNLNPANLAAGTAGISVTGNAGTVTNGVYTTGSYSNPAWITSLAGSKVSGGTAGISINGNAATVTNGVYTTGSYADPVWLASLAGSKITGSVASATSATTAATATNSTQLGGVAASGYQLATTSACGATEYLKSITPTGVTTCGTPATVIPVPLALSDTNASVVISGSNGGSGSGLFGSSTSGHGVVGNAASAGNSAVLGTHSLASGFGVSGYNIATSNSGRLGTGSEGVYGSSSTGIGVHGVTVDTASLNYGVWGESPSTSGRGVLGKATALTGATNGVVGQSDSTAGIGVRGLTTAASGVNYGVSGISASAAGAGVYGSNGAGGDAGFFQGNVTVTGKAVSAATVAGDGATTLATKGYVDSGAGVPVPLILSANTGAAIVQATNSGSGAAGNFQNDGSGRAANITIGNAANTSPALVATNFGTGNGVSSQATGGIGLYGASTSSHGVYGYATALTGGTIGVSGRSDSNSGTGVQGSAVASSGTTFGVDGSASSTAGTGVRGTASAATGVTYGVYGSALSASGYGVYTPDRIYAGDGYVQPGSGGEALRMLRGSVTAAGGIAAGAGFSVTPGAAGFYTITYSTAFSATPTVVVTPKTNGNQCATVTTGQSATQSFMHTFNCSTLASINVDFQFIAIGTP